MTDTNPPSIFVSSPRSLPTLGKRRLLLLVVVLAGLSSGSCRKAPEPARLQVIQEPAGEPQHYSATVVRTVDDGSHAEVTVTRLTRSGDMLREEWNQDGETRVSIWRPDLGNHGQVFLLSLDRKLYVESDLGYDRQLGTQTASVRTTQRRVEGDEIPLEKSQPIEPDAIDRAFEYESPPELLEADELPEEVIEGHPCRVFRRRAVFADGHTETTLMFCARDLEGLAIRVESITEGASGRVRVVTERRDIGTDVSPDQFVVPSSFKRVSSLAHNKPRR